MSIHHHPDDSTLVSYAAGSLAPALALVVDCHLTWCARCREHIAEAERLGGDLLEEITPLPLSAASRERVLARLEEIVPTEEPGDELPPVEAPSDKLPPPLRALLSEEFDSIRWQPLGPGIRQMQLDRGRGGARLLRIAPGTSMPMHGHGGSELTLVLQGSYCDEIGRFAAGDVADLDPGVEHQPIADTDRPCICLIATDAPLRFRGLVPRLLQPLFGI